MHLLASVLRSSKLWQRGVTRARNSSDLGAVSRRPGRGFHGSVVVRAAPALGVVACGAVFIACGGGSAASGGPRPPTPAAASATGVDVSPVKEPSATLLVARLGRPADTLETLRTWMKASMPPSVPVVPKVTSEMATEALLGMELGALVDLEQPMDAVATAAFERGNVRAGAALSVGLRDEALARATFTRAPLRLVPGAHGLLVIEGLGLGRPKRTAAQEEETEEEADDGDDLQSQRKCGLVPAAPNGKLRLVCGFGEDALSRLAPYLARTLVRGTDTADLSVDVRMAPVHAFVRENREAISPAVRGFAEATGGGNATSALLAAVVEDLADYAMDTQGARMALRIDPQGAVLEGTTAFGSSRSLLTRLSLVGATDGAKLARDAFGRLPQDALGGGHWGGIATPTLDHARQLVADAVREMGATKGASVVDAKALADAVSAWLQAPPVAYGTGVDARALERALSQATAGSKASTAKPAKGRKAPPAASESPLAAATWSLLALGDGGTFGPRTKDLVQRWQKVEMQIRAAEAKERQKAKKAGAKDADAEASDAARRWVFKFLPAAADKLPKGAVVLQMARGGESPSYVVMAPSGTRSVVAVASSRELAGEKVRTTVDAAAGTTLSARAGVAPLLDGSLSSGGFFAADGFSSILAFQLPALMAGGAMGGPAGDGTVTSGADGAALLAAVSRAKGSLDGAVQVRTWADSGAGEAGALRFSARVPKATIDGLLRLAMTAKGLP